MKSRLRTSRTVAALVLGTALVAVSGSAPAKPSIAAAIEAEMELDRPKVVVGYEGPLYILIDLKAFEVEREDGDRPELNLGLVLDRSGSMKAEGKMDYLKRASLLAVDQLEERDRLSVIEYDDEISVLWPSGPLENPGSIKKMIEKLTPRGSTNLTGGMMRGVSEVLTSLARINNKDEVVSRVMLLSDGLANQGITDPDDIARLVREAKSKGVRISTLGLGRDYDEDLMQLIAENGGGNYYYIENPEQMSRIFTEELMTMFQTVARDATLNIEFGRDIDGVEIVSFGSRSVASGDDVDMGDFYSNEERTLVLRLDPDDDAFDRRGEVDLGDIEFSYRDVETGRRVTVEFPVEVDVVRSKEKAEAAQNARVMVETMLLESEREHEKAVRLYEEGRHDEADLKLNDLAMQMDNYSSSFDDERLGQKAEALRVEQSQMKEAAMAPAASATYLKKSKQRLYQAKKGSRTLYSLQEGDKGLNVERLQQALKDTGDFKGDVDGVFDAELTTAVREFQTREGMSVDGLAGPATLSELGLY